MRDVSPGEVWLVDLGMAAKIRPCLMLTPAPTDDELALHLVLPHTTALREGNPWQVAIPKPWLKPGAFHVQQVYTVPITKLERRLGVLTIDEFKRVKRRLADRLGL